MKCPNCWEEMEIENKETFVCLNCWNGIRVLHSKEYVEQFWKEWKCSCGEPLDPSGLCVICDYPYE